MKYFYYINLDERSEFYADVRRENAGNQDGDTVFEINGFEILDDGYMKHKRDIHGLENYLKDLGLIKGCDILCEGN